MQILYETVVYGSGTVGDLREKGFAQLHYDNEPSPLTVLGGGTESIFGVGGVLDGIGSVIDNAGRGNVLGAILAETNTYNNAKKLKKSAVKEELRGLAKKGVKSISKNAGNVTNPVAQFVVGGALIAGADKIEGTLRGSSDNNSNQNNTVITTNQLNTQLHLTAEEAYQLVTTNASVQNEIAAGIYFKDIGSRKGSTIAASNIEYNNATDNVKTVYNSKAITNIRKLVTEGYIKIDRANNNVSVAVEKVNI
jgi:hypothetical protein